MDGAALTTEDRVILRAGAGAIVAGGAVLLALLLFLLPSGPLPALAVGVVAGGGLALLGLAQAGGAVQLGALLVAATALIGGSDGFSPGEGLYLAGSLLYAAAWYGRRLIGGEPLVVGPDDAVALAWLVFGIGAMLVAGGLAGNALGDLRAEAISLFPFLLFFPVKDAVARERWGLGLVVAALALYGLYSTVLNAFAIRTAVAEATVWYEVANVRFTTGETAMAACLLIGLSALPAVRSLAARGALVAICAGVLAGLLIAKSRGYWISTLFGLGLAVAASPREIRRRQVLYLVGGGAALAALASALFYEQVALLVEGVGIRFASLATAATADVSLLNRYAENRAAWADIRANPILGYGWGRQTTYYSTISEGTSRWSFVHNAYVFVWHKAGLWGLGLVLALWARAAIRAAKAARTSTLPLAERAAAAGVVGAVAALALVANTSNPLGIADASLVLVLVLATGHGLGQRAEEVGRRAAGE